MANRVNFSGLITFVPKETEERPEEVATGGETGSTGRMDKAMSVLFVNGFEPHFGRPKDAAVAHREMLHPHIPVVTFRLGDLHAESPRQPDMTAGGYGACFISYETFQIDVDPPSDGAEAAAASASSAGGLQYDHQPIDHPLPPPPKPKGAAKESDRRGAEAAETAEAEVPWRPRRCISAGRAGGAHATAVDATTGDGTSEEVAPGDLSWIMPLRHAINDADITLEPSLFQTRPQPGEPPPSDEVGVGRLLIARTRLTSGRLYSRSFAHKQIRGEHRIPYWEFAIGDQPGHHYQPLSTVVSYEPMKSGELVIGSKSGKDWEIPPLRFRFREHDHVEVNFWNAPLFDLLNLLGGEGSHRFPSASGYSSFRSYFRLLTGATRSLPSMSPNEDGIADYQVYEDVPCKDVGCPCSLAPAHENA